MLRVIYGPDPFLRREALNRLKRELDEDGMLDTNTSLFQAPQSSPEEVIAACAAPPFLGSHRLVVLEGLLASRGRTSGRRARAGAELALAGLGPWQALVDFADQMPPTTVLLLLDGEVKDSAAIEALRAKGIVERLEPPNDRALPDWIQKRARAIGLKIDGRAARLLAQMVGGQKAAGSERVELWALANELDKLAAYAGDSIVREDDVSALSPVTREQKGYLLADAIMDGQAARAQKLLHELLAQGEPGQLLLATIEGRVRRLAITREMLDEGAPSAAIGAQVGAREYALERLIEQAARHSPAGLRAACLRVVEADADVKRGVCDEQVSLELLVEDLAAMLRSRAA